MTTTPSVAITPLTQDMSPMYPSVVDTRNGGEGCFAEGSTTVSIAEEGEEVELAGEPMGELPGEMLVAVPDPSVSKPLLLAFGGSIARQDSAPRPICGRRYQKDVGAGEHP